MSDTTYVPPAPAAEPAPGNFFRRVAETFWSPVALFRRFGADAPWWDAALLAALLTVSSFLLVPASAWDAMAREAVRANPQAPMMSAGMQMGISMAFGFVFLWIVLFIQAGILTLVFNVFMSGTARFRQYLALSAHTAIIGAVGAFANLPVIAKQGNLRATISLGALVGGDPDSFLAKLLGFFSVFLIWQLVVVGLGVSAMNRKIAPGVAVAVVFAVNLLFAAGIAAF